MALKGAVFNQKGPTGTKVEERERERERERGFVCRVVLFGEHE